MGSHEFFFFLLLQQMQVRDEIHSEIEGFKIYKNDKKKPFILANNWFKY